MGLAARGRIFPYSERARQGARRQGTVPSCLASSHCSLAWNVPRALGPGTPQDFQNKPQGPWCSPGHSPPYYGAMVNTCIVPLALLVAHQSQLPPPCHRLTADLRPQARSEKTACFSRTSRVVCATLTFLRARCQPSGPDWSSECGGASGALGTPTMNTDGKGAIGLAPHHCGSCRTPALPSLPA